jgi:hypothetical protein
VNDDDPFSAVAQNAQLAHITPLTAALAGKVFTSILADVAAGREPHQIVASVRTILAVAPTPAMARAAACGTSQSRRLRPPKKKALRA